MIKDSGTTDPDATERDTTSEAGIRARRGIDEILTRWGLPAITCIAVLAGTILRFWPRSSLWLDEALSVNIAALPLGDLTEALRHDGHPPLYYLLLHVWMKVFGDSDWAVRALSGVISLASLPLAYLAGLRMARRSTAELSDPRRVALIAVAVTATMPFAVRYGAEARMYSLVMLLVLCGYLVVDTLLAVPTTPRLVLPTVCGAFVTALLLWTHYWSMWLLGAVGILALVTLWSRRDGMSDRQVVAGPIAMIISLVVGGLLYLPWVPTMAYQASHTGTPWGSPSGRCRCLC
ncbi:MAG: glycosyltransferase family 39 protein [Microthrixaceae bacterium]